MLWVVLIVLLLLIIYFYRGGKSGSERLEDGDVEGGGKNRIRLYEDFNYKDLLYSSDLKFLKYELRGDVRAADIDLTGADAGVFVELWNVRPDQTLASSVSDFYENTTYTTPDRLRGVSGNMVLIARVESGGQFKSNQLPLIRKVLIVCGSGVAPPINTFK
jgi:hypothetical protein